MYEPYFFFDFDSTFVTIESLDELARIALVGHPEAEERVRQIHETTRLGMEGTISFEESLRRRLVLMEAKKPHLEELLLLLERSITPSFLLYKNFFLEQRGRVYILSGGCVDFIAPVVASFGITEEFILANRFIYDAEGHILGVDDASPLAHTGGKSVLLSQLTLPGEKYMIGDGYTDYETKSYGGADKFLAYAGNVCRKQILEGADGVMTTFSDLFLYI